MKAQNWLFITIFLGMIIAGILFLASPVNNNEEELGAYSQHSTPRQIHRLSSFLSRMLPESITPESIKRKYRFNKINILLVPGHDNVYSGAVFKNLEEADLNIQLANHLYNLFKEDNRFNVVVVRDLETGNYTQEFNNYFVNEKDSILSFMKERKELMKSLLGSGDIEENVTIKHNFAPGDTAIKLYGINKWANENNIDLSLHLHFNDYRSRPNQVGKYTGFSIYVPEKQFSNARASKDIAQTLLATLKKYFPASNFPKEAGGIVESQELIALGSNASQKGAALLLENGYIYESRFSNSKIREEVLEEIALQSYQGIKRYFDSSYFKSDFQTSLLPYNFQNNLKRGYVANLDVLALQAALHNQGLYPPKNKTLNECPINGNFGPCTEKAVINFQEVYRNDILSPSGYSRGTGFVGFYTLKKLNELYSPELR